MKQLNKYMKRGKKFSGLAKFFLFVIAFSVIAYAGDMVFEDGNLDIDQNMTVSDDVLFVDSILERVGIGTTSPARKLHIDNSAGNGATIRLQDQNSVSNGLEIGTESSKDVFIWNYENADIYWGTNNNEEMRLKGGGRLLLQDLTAPGSDPMCWDGLGASYIGDCSSTKIIKRDIVSMNTNRLDSIPTASRWTDILMQIEPSFFYWNKTNWTTQEQAGFIAEDIAEIEGAGFLVKRNSTDSIRGVNEKAIDALAYKVIQEQQQQIEKLEARVSALE